MSKKIKLIIGSTRQGRVSKQIADWLVVQAKEAGVVLEVLDLKEISLTMFDSPVSPAYVPVDTPEAKAWAEMVSDAEGLVFLTSEYNRSIPASLKNAIDYLYGEWAGKPTAIVSYGYVDGGGSATKHLKDILNWVKSSLVGQDTAISFTQETFDRATGLFVNIDESLGAHRKSFVSSLKAINEA